MSATAFYKHQPVIEFLSEVLKLNESVLKEKNNLTDAERVRFLKEIKGKISSNLENIILEKY